MKLTPDSVVSSGHIPYERLNSHGKTHTNGVGQQELFTGCCTFSPNSNITTHRLDSVCCWGDVPKRSARTDSMMEQVTHESNSSSRRAVTTREQDCAQRNTSPNEASITPHEPKQKQPDDGAFGITGTKASGTTGREKLLEWLRASQAKRDENNRLVFSRWIDRSMNNQATVASNTAFAAFNAMGNFGTMNYQHDSMFSVLPTLPGLATAPTVACGGPLGILTSTNMPGSSLLTNGTIGFHNSLWWPTMCSGKHTPIDVNAFASPQSSSILTISPPGTSTCSVASDSSVPVSPKSACNFQPGLNDNLITRIQSPMPTCYTYNQDHMVVKQSSCRNQESHQVEGEPTVTNESASSAKDNCLVSPASAVDYGSSDLETNQVGVGVQPDNYYVGVPLLNESGYSNMFYYYCYQTPVTNNLVSQRTIRSSGIQQQGLFTNPKIPSMHQPLVYLLPPNAAAIQYSPLSPPACIPDSYTTCLSHFQSIQNTSIYNAEYHQPDRIAEQERADGTDNGSLIANSESASDSATTYEQPAAPGPNIHSSITTTLDFDMDKWYKALRNPEDPEDTVKTAHVSVPQLTEMNEYKHEKLRNLVA